MAVSKNANFKYDGSRDSQFSIWRISPSSASKQISSNAQMANKKFPIQLTDTDALLEEIMFQACRIPRKKRKVQLSLKQTRILTTLLPNAIINIPDFSQDCTDNFVGVLLFADVSGFTALCEKYKGFGKSGSDKLTVTLNNYLGAMVEVIYNHGGDVLKFSGDAILALWKLDAHEYMYSLIHRVVCCALYIQRSLGVYETDVKVLLKVKLAISAGNMTFAVIGNDNSRHYLVAGSPVTEVKAAEQVCISGEVVLSLSAWGHLSAVNYEYHCKGNDHVQIIRIIYNPENSKREILHSETKDGFYKSEFHLYNRLHREILKKKTGMSGSGVEARTLAEEVSKRELNSELKTFLIPSVIQQIDADLPMEYLSEMRNVTVMFVNIVPNKLNTKKLIDMVNQAYIMICSLAYTAMGSVNKVSLFDKDVMILIIFGLRGFNHEGEVAGCLKCGYDIRQACCTLEGVYTVSVAVTSGEAYCGVVGHPLRREYTVMGPVVNKAARIMCAYSGKVTCDRDTFMSSNLSASFFTIQEKKYLKGIEDTGPIYEFTREKSKNTLAAMHEGMYPILARTEEIQIFRQTLRSINHYKSTEKAILVVGHGRIGKTRLLDEMIIEAHSKGIKPIVVALHTVHSTLGYGTAQSIIKQILEIPDSATISEKEQKLSVVLKNHITLSDYWYLNEVMNVKFPQNIDGNYNIDPAGKFEQIKKLFHIILTQGTRSPIFAIDDIDFCDELSWRLLLSVIDKRVKFLIMTMPKRLRPITAKFLKFPPEIDSHIIKLTLPRLPDNVLATLACQILNAKAVPVEVERMLIEKSNGNPGWCESFLLSLCQSNVLKVEELPEGHIRSLGLITPPEVYLKRKRYVAVSDNAHETAENRKLSDAEGPKLTPEEVKSELPKTRSSVKLKLVRFLTGKNGSRAEHNLNRTSIASNPEEAYEDLKQTIKQIRSRSKVFSSQSFDAFHNEDHDTLSDKNIMDDGWIRTRLPRISSEIREPVLFGNFDSSDSSGSNHSMSNSFSTESLKHRLSLIRQRYLRRQTGTITEYHEELSVGEPKLQSLFDLREDTKCVPRKSKSAGPMFSRIRSFVVNEDTPKPYEFTDNDVYEFSHYMLWESYTDVQLSKSIKIFLQNKAKLKTHKIREPRSENDGHLAVTNSSSAASTPSLPEESKTSRRTITGARDILRSFSIQRDGNWGEETHGSVQKYRNVHESPAHEVTQERQFEHEINGEGKSSSHGSNANVNMKKKSSHTFGKGNRSNYESANDKELDRNRGWVEKLFDWVRKLSDVPLNDSYLEFPKEPDEKNVMIPAILVNPRIKLNEVKTPECFVGVIMTVFDCLKPYEQIMLKCGSVIGERFTRKMLNAIMHDPNQLLLAEAVKRLFDMKIICCGSETKESDTDQERQCSCALSDNDIIDDTMPMYSYCRVFLFRYALFRTTLYELIPVEQKREFHIRAVQFLENNRVYCPSCERFRKQTKQFSLPVAGLHLDQKTPILPPSPRSKRITGSEDADKTAEKKSHKKMDEVSPLILFSWLPNFQKCNCLALEADALRQLIDHCVAAGLKEKEIDFIMSYSSLMITLGKLEEAEKLLGEVEATLKSPEVNPFTNKKQKKRRMGRLYLLLGNLYLELGELKKANSYLWSALRFTGWGAASIYSLGSLEYAFRHLIQKIYQYYPRPPHHPCRLFQVRDFKTICLSLTCNVFMIQGKWKLAKLIALRNLNFLWRNNHSLIDLCNAYSNAVDVYRHCGDFKFCRKLESAAAKSCIKEFNYTTALEVIAFGRLNCSVLNARLISGYLVAASKLGESALKLSQSISSQEVESYTISKVTFNMMLLGKLNKAAGLILLLPDHDIWHHILSLEFILETGFAVERSNVCFNGITNTLNDLDLLDTNTFRRAVSTVYVWLSRIGEYEVAAIWRKKLPQIHQIPLPGDTVDNMVTIMNILQGDLLLLSSYPDDDPRKNQLKRKVTVFIKALRESTRKTAVILPRFLHLQAYNQYRLGNKNHAFRTLSHAKEVSIMQGNALERCWISHSKKVWTESCDFDTDYWIKAAKAGTLMKWTESHDLLSWKNHMYSLK